MVWKPHVTVAAIIEYRDRFLLVEERIDGESVYNQPAGHLEDGESPLEAVIRETREETTHDFSPRALVGIYRWKAPRAGETFLRFAFCGETTGPVPARELDPQITATHWLGYATLRAGTHPLRSPLVLRCIEDYRAGERYPLSLLSDIPG